MNETRQITWTASNGDAIEVNLAITHDGPAARISWTVNRNGNWIGYCEGPEPCKHPVAVAKLGRSIGLTQANYDSVMAARNELYATQEWQDYLTSKAQTDAEANDYYSHRECMARVMGY